MKLLHEAYQEKKFDVRVIEKNVQIGFTTHDDVKKAQSSLPDDAANAVWISLDELRDRQESTL